MPVALRALPALRSGPLGAPAVGGCGLFAGGCPASWPVGSAGGRGGVDSVALAGSRGVVGSVGLAADCGVAASVGLAEDRGLVGSVGPAGSGGGGVFVGLAGGWGVRRWRVLVMTLRMGGPRFVGPVDTGE